MSVLDMFASALGAFIMISVILFPYFNRHRELQAVKAKIQETNKELHRINALNLASAKLKDARYKQLVAMTIKPGAIDKCLKLRDACKVSLGKTFLVIATEWRERCDVDMYVTDPLGNEFTWANNNEHGNIKNSKAQLSLDMQDGPGIEIWQDPSAVVGTYKLQYRLVGCKSGVQSVHISGWSIDRSAGKRDLPIRVVNGAGSAVWIATFRVRSDGSVARTLSQPQ